jgi:hypothetical protein
VALFDFHHLVLPCLRCSASLPICLDEPPGPCLNPCLSSFSSMKNAVFTHKTVPPLNP